MERTRRQIIIEPSSGWQPVNWRELVEYRDLFRFLVARDILVVYKQTVLGFGWVIVRPLFSMVVFSLIFGGLAGIPSDGLPYPLFSYTALVPWTYFSNALSRSSSSLVGSAGMLTKVYFPRLVVPLTPVLAGLVDLVVASLVLAVLMIWYGVSPTVYVLLLPALVVLMVVTAAGIGIWTSALAIQYRDVNHAMTLITQLLMYAAPVVWPVSLISEKFPIYGGWIRLLYGLYPMAGVIEGFRSALLGATPMPWDLLSVGALSSTFILFTGALFFRRMERTFADVA